MRLQPAGGWKVAWGSEVRACEQLGWSHHTRAWYTPGYPGTTYRPSKHCGTKVAPVDYRLCHEHGDITTWH
eukprot:575909-Rhodomonas_salina.3